MIQHVLLLDLVPILLICGLTKLLLRPVTRRLQRIEHALGPVGHPVFAVVLYVGAVWSWHVPAMYDAALAHPAVHVLEHTSYAVAGGLYWWHLLSPIRSRQRLAGMGPALYMAATKLLLGLLGITLVFAPGTIYAFYAHQGGFWGLSTHADQSLAGGLMALEQSLVMGIALAVLFARMLGESEREAQRAERAEVRRPDHGGRTPEQDGTEAGRPPGRCRRAACRCHRQHVTDHLPSPTDPESTTTGRARADRGHLCLDTARPRARRACDPTD